MQAELDAGADVMARDEGGWTSVHYAGTSEIIQALSAAGADAKAKDKYGRTPWDLA